MNQEVLENSNFTSEKNQNIFRRFKNMISALLKEENDDDITKEEEIELKGLYMVQANLEKGKEYTSNLKDEPVLRSEIKHEKQELKNIKTKNKTKRDFEIRD